MHIKLIGIVVKFVESHSRNPFMKHVVLAAIVLGFAPVSSVLANGVEACGAKSVKTNRSLGVNGSENTLFSAPSPTGIRLVNAKATAALGTKTYLSIDKSTTVQEECTQDGWSRIQVTSPEYLRESHRGWVKSTALRTPSADASGKRVFTEADFYFDKKSAPHKATIIAGVNKIARENDRCKDIDPSSATISTSKGTPANPVFYVTCGKGASVHNVFFSKSDVELGKAMAAAQNLPRTVAVDLCEKHVKSNANHPSTVKFSSERVMEHANGRTTVEGSFKAKNSFNLELAYDVKCLLDSKGVIEASINEKR